MAEIIFYLRCKQCGDCITLPDSTMLDPNQRYRKMPREDWHESFFCPFCSKIFDASKDDIKIHPVGKSRQYLRDVPHFYKLNVQCSVKGCKSTRRLVMPSTVFLTDKSKAAKIDKLIKKQLFERDSDTTYVQHLNCPAGHTILQGVELSSDEIAAFFE